MGCSLCLFGYVSLFLLPSFCFRLAHLFSFAFSFSFSVSFFFIWFWVLLLNTLQIPAITADFLHLKMLGHVYVFEYAKDLAQIVKDVARYGGAYRLEVLSQIMASTPRVAIRELANSGLGKDALNSPIRPAVRLDSVHKSRQSKSLRINCIIDGSERDGMTVYRANYRRRIEILLYCLLQAAQTSTAGGSSIARPPSFLSVCPFHRMLHPTYVPSYTSRTKHYHPLTHIPSLRISQPSLTLPSFENASRMRAHPQSVREHQQLKVTGSLSTISAALFVALAYALVSG